MNDGLVRRESISKKTETTLASDEHSLVRKDDIAYNTMRMWQGAFGLASEDGIVSPAYVVLQPRPGVDPLFASYWFKTPEMIHRFWSYSYGLTDDRLRLYYRDFAQIRVVPPPVERQRHIGKIARTLSEEEGVLATLLGKKRKLYVEFVEHLCLGRASLGSELRERKRCDEWRYGELPATWEICTVGDLAAEVKERASGQDLPVLLCSKSRGIVFSSDYFDKKVFSDDLSAYKVVERGCLAYPSNHVEEGSIGINSICDKGLVSPIYTVFRFKDPRVSPEFGLLQFKTDLFRHIFNVMTNSSVDRRGSLRWKEFSRIKFLLPPLEEQLEIVNCLDRMQSEIQLLSQRVEALSKRNKSLVIRLIAKETQVG
jgi:type I restriction enzyme S subunit